MVVITSLRPINWKRAKPIKVIYLEQKPIQPAPAIDVTVTHYNRGKDPIMFDFARSKLALSFLSENTSLCHSFWKYKDFVDVSSSIWQTQPRMSTTIFLAIANDLGPSGKVREAKDIWSVMGEIDKQSKTPCSQAVCRDVMKAQRRNTAIRYEHRHVEGFAICYGLDDDRLYLELLCATSAGSQVGTSILASIKDWAKQEDYKTLELLAVNSALGFYIKHGFKKFKESNESGLTAMSIVISK